MSYTHIGTDEDLGKQILKLANQLRFVEKGNYQAYQYMKLHGKPFKVTVISITDEEYVSGQ